VAVVTQTHPTRLLAGLVGQEEEQLGALGRVPQTPAGAAEAILPMEALVVLVLSFSVCLLRLRSRLVVA